MKYKIKSIIEKSRKPIESIVGVIYDEEMLLHRSYGESHPECPERISAIHLNLIKKDLWESLVKIECHAAKDSDLSLVHDQAHIDKIKNSKYDYELSKDNVKIELQKYKNQYSPFQNENYENKFTVRAAYLAAGGTVDAVKALCEPGSQLSSVFAIVRPPGHHAHCSSICGFCWFNNVAIAAKVAQTQLN